MVDGRRAHGLVQPRLGHTAHARAAVDGDGARCIRQQSHSGNNRQAGGGIDVVAAVLDDGAFGGRFAAQAAELRGDLDHNAFGCAQANGFRRAAGQQQAGRTRCAQCRAGAGSVAAAQQLLPAADVVFKFGLGLRFRITEQGSVLHRR